MKKPFVRLFYVLRARRTFSSCSALYSKNAQTRKRSTALGPQPSKWESISSCVEGTTHGSPGAGACSSAGLLLSVENATILICGICQKNSKNI